MGMVTSLYGSTALKAQRAAGSAKPKAGQRHMHKGERPSAVQVYVPDADGNLRIAGEPIRTAKRVRWDSAGLFVVRS